MANEFKIKKGLIVTGADGGTVVDIQGSQGQLFSVTDDLSGSIFAVSDISGVPILDVNSSGLSTFDGSVGIGLTSTTANLEVKSIQDSSFDEGIGVVRSNTSQTGYINMVGGAMNINAPNAIPIKFRDGGNTNLTIGGDGHATFAGNVSGVAGTFTGNLAVGNASAAEIYLNRNSANYINASNAAGYLVFRTGGSTTALTLNATGAGTFGTQAFATTATSSGDASSTLTTKGYVDSLITGATIYRGAWQAGISATSSAATTASTTLTVTAAILDADGNTPVLVGAVVTGEGITGIVKVASVTSSTVYVLDTAIDATATAYIFSPIYGAPSLDGVTQTSGYYYICSEAGSATPNGANSEPNTWNVGDWCIYNDVSGTGQWQKIDNSSVLSGAGTGQTVALWEGPSSVSDSDTLGNAPITVSGNDTIFAGTVEAATYYKSSGTSAVLGTDTSGEVLLRPTSSISSTAQSSFTTTLATIGTDATFAGDVTISTSEFSQLDIITSRSGATDNIGGVQFYKSSTLKGQIFGVNDGKVKIATNGNTVALTLDESQNATFAGTVTAADLLTVNGDGHLFLGADEETPKIDMMYDDHDSGAGWDTRIFTGKTDDLPNGQSFPTSTIAGGYGTQYQANSDGAFFGIIPYTAGHYRPIINWGDDVADTPFSFQFNGTDIVTINYAGGMTAPSFTGDHRGTINAATTGVTQTAGNNSTLIATTGYADAAAAAVPIGNYLPLSAGASYPLTGALNILIPGDPKLILQSTSTDTSDWNYINFVGRDTVRDGYIGTDADGDMQVYSDKNSSSVKLAASGILLSGGNVGIGVTGPESKLQVDGGIQMADDTDTASATKVGTMRYRTGTEYVEVTGTELITNGDFENGSTGWSGGQTAPATVTFSGGKMTIVSPSGESAYRSQGILVPTKTYRGTVDVVVRSGTCKLQWGTGTAATSSVVTATGSYVFYKTIPATGADDKFYLARNNACDVDFDNVSVMEVTAEDASYADMCMQTGASTYEWVNILRNTY